MFYVTKECRGKKRHLSFPPPWESRTLSPLQEPQTPLSSLRTQALSTCLGVDPLNTSPPYLPPEKSICQSRITVRTRHGTKDWFQIGKGVLQGCILSPCLFNLYAEYIMQNTRLDEAQTGIKIAGRNINNLRYADDTPLWQKVKRN